MTRRVFISRVSRELGSYSEELRNALQSVEIASRTQLSFRQEADTETTLEKLSKYIADSDIVLCLIGTYSGGFPADAGLERPIFPAPREDRPEKTWRDLLSSGFSRLSYTQWEYVLALYWGKTAFIYNAQGHNPDTAPPAAGVDDLPQQQSFIKEILSSISFDRQTFENADRLCRHALCDLWPVEARDEEVLTVIARYEQKLDALLTGQEIHRRFSRRALAFALSCLALVGLGVWMVKRDTGKVKDDTGKTKQNSEQLLTGQKQTDQKTDKLAAQLTQVQEALSSIQLQTDLAKDPIGKWPPERLETALAEQMKMKVDDLRAILAAGRTSLDALVAGQALLASGKKDAAGEKFDLVLQQTENASKQRKQAFEGKAQIAFDAVHYEEALSYRQKAAALVDKATDPLAWADAQEQITLILLSLSRHKESEPLIREIARIREEKLGPADPQLATALNLLAQLLKATNRLSEAEPLMQRALKIDETSYGPDDPNVARDLNNFAQLLQVTNRLSEAEPLMQRALKIDETSYDPNYPNVAICLNNLAQLLQATNRLNEAEPLMQRALKIDETSYGPDHPKVAIDLNNLAGLLQATNRPSEAEPLIQRALKIDEASNGPDHPNVARDLNNLATLLQATNRLSEAEPLYRRALKIDETSYGPDHPNVAIRLNNLARLLQATNRLSEAEPLSRRMLGIFLAVRRSTGHENPNFQVATATYLGILNALDLSEAEQRSKLESLAGELGMEKAEVLAQFTGILGPFDVTVSEVVPYGQGPTLGILPGDIVRRYNGEAITTMAQLVKLTNEMKTEAIPVEIQRGSETLKLTAKPGRLGLMLENKAKPPEK